MRLLYPYKGSIITMGVDYNPLCLVVFQVRNPRFVIMKS